LTYMPGILERDHAYQRHVVRLAAAILGDSETYLAGNDILYNRRQAPRQLRRLSAPRNAEMKQWPPERVDSLVGELEAAPPKLVIDDYRVRLLPAEFSRYLESRYERIWSSVRVYAPVVPAGEGEFEIWFDGDYVTSADAIIDGARIAPSASIQLKRGRHRNDSSGEIRLRWQPPGFHAHADPKMRSRRPMFARAYDY
jgi:hypothetical protein